MNFRMGVFFEKDNGADGRMSSLVLRDFLQRSF
jgi:hypothetical protein